MTVAVSTEYSTGTTPTNAVEELFDALDNSGIEGLSEGEFSAFGELMKAQGLDRPAPTAPDSGGFAIDGSANTMPGVSSIPSGSMEVNSFQRPFSIIDTSSGTWLSMDDLSARIFGEGADAVHGLPPPHTVNRGSSTASESETSNVKSDAMGSSNLGVQHASAPAGGPASTSGTPAAQFVTSLEHILASFDSQLATLMQQWQPPMQASAV